MFVQNEKMIFMLFMTNKFELNLILFNLCEILLIYFINIFEIIKRDTPEFNIYVFWSVYFFYLTLFVDVTSSVLIIKVLLLLLQSTNWGIIVTTRMLCLTVDRTVRRTTYK